MSSTAHFTAVVDGLLAEGLHVRFRARGRSMLPAVRDKECVTIAPIQAAQVRPGDVVLCSTRRGPIAHRVTAVASGADGARHFTLRGDASLEDDAPVTGAQVRARVESVERDGRVLSLVIAGGAVGRALFMGRLRLRTTLVAAARACLTAVRPYVLD